MATPEQVAEVRENTAELDPENWGDDAIGLLIDEQGVNGASATIWRKKAASYAGLVNVSEAGSSHSFSDLHKSALAMEAKFASMEDIGGVVTDSGRVKIRTIQRDLRE
jgi:hypothetical protein